MMAEGFRPDVRAYKEAPYYALFIVGLTANLVEILLDHSARARRAPAAVPA